MKNRPFEPTILLTQRLNGIYAKFLLHIVTHFKSNDLAVKTVENRRNVEFSVSTLNLGNICQELFERCSSSEISLDQILSVLCCCISLCIYS